MDTGKEAVTARHDRNANRRPASHLRAASRVPESSTDRSAVSRYNEKRASVAALAPATSLQPSGGGSPVARKLRLLVISSDTYPPKRVDVAVLFGEELAGRGHRIDWILQSESDCRRSYIASWGGGQVWVAPSNHSRSLIGRLLKHAAGIRNDARIFGLLRGTRYDVIQVKDKFIAGVFAVLAARLYRKRFVYWLSFPFPEFYLTKAQDGLAPYPILYRLRGLAFGFLLYRVLLPAADHVFVQSEQMRRDVAAKGIALSKLTAVPMGIKLNSGAAAPARSNSPVRTPCFVYLGTLGRERRIDFLLRVLAVVRAAIPEVTLYLVGKGESPEDEEFLLQEARRLGVLPAVVFVGQLPQQDALRYVQAADVCVSPFYPTPILNSTSPTKLVEYMSMGKAVVANTHPEQQLLIEESGCGYCVPYEEQAFGDAITKLLRSPEAARAMGERGKRYVLEHRGYDAIADRVEREMLAIVAGAHP
jgi:glycosyltransferase involved in cell wall biosynthesis